MFSLTQIRYTTLSAKRSGWKQSGGKASESVASSSSSSSSSTSSSTSVAPGEQNVKAPKSLSRRIVRLVRTFEPKIFLHKHVFGIYCSFIGGAFIFANYKQHFRMQKLYPNYDEVRTKNGSQYGDMKEQELTDVLAFNQKADNMRADVKSRM